MLQTRSGTNWIFRKLNDEGSIRDRTRNLHGPEEGVDVSPIGELPSIIIEPAEEPKFGVNGSYAGPGKRIFDGIGGRFITHFPPIDGLERV